VNGGLQGLLELSRELEEGQAAKVVGKNEGLGVVDGRGCKVPCFIHECLVVVDGRGCKVPCVIHECFAQRRTLLQQHTSTARATP